MFNIVALKNRYKDVKYGLSSIGMGKYLVNSDENINLNSSGDGEYILDENGFVEEFKFDTTVKPSFWYKDEAGTELVSDEYLDSELVKHNFNVFDGLYLKDNPAYTIRTYRAKPEEYYPHPWYPDKQIIEFECIRMAPYWTYGKKYEVESWFTGDAFIQADDNETRLWVWEALEYPEFFKPIYEQGETTVQ